MSMIAAFAVPACRAFQHTRRAARATKCGRLQMAAAPGAAGRLRRVRAAALIIGDEILTGKTLDTNTHTLAKFLFSHGATLARAETVPDDMATISDCAKRLSATHDLVFCSGGLGSTHDDVTYEAIAQAFNLQLELHEPTLTSMKTMYATKGRDASYINAARQRMAMLPSPSEIISVHGLWVPIVVCNRNVYLLPGIPSLFERMLHAVPGDRFGTIAPRARRVVHTRWREGEIADPLSEFVREFNDVDFGSYPATTDEAKLIYTTKLTCEGDDDGRVEQAARQLAERVQGALC